MSWIMIWNKLQLFAIWFFYHFIVIFDLRFFLWVCPIPACHAILTTFKCHGNYYVEWFFCERAATCTHMLAFYGWSRKDDSIHIHAFCLTKDWWACFKHHSPHILSEGFHVKLYYGYDLGYLGSLGPADPQNQPRPGSWEDSWQGHINVANEYHTFARTALFVRQKLRISSQIYLEKK